MSGRYGLFLNRATSSSSSSSSSSQRLHDLISTFAAAGQDYEAVSLYQKLQDQIRLDRSLSLYLFKACINLGLLPPARLLHDRLLRHGIPVDGIVGNSLITVYARCGSLREAQKMFDSLRSRSSVSWSALIGGYVQHGQARKAMELFDEMGHAGISPNRSVFLSALKACGIECDVQRGMILHHEMVLRCGDRGYGSNEAAVIESSVLDMYAKCGCLGEAQRVFDRLSSRDVVAWNALLSGYSRHGEGHRVLAIYQEMRENGIEPTKTTFLCALKGCFSTLPAIEGGKAVHDLMVRKLVSLDEELVCALIDMYANCGALDEARKVLDTMHHAYRAVGMWVVMIGGYVQHGHNLAALNLFRKLPRDFRATDRDLYPNLLKACGNLGAWSEGALLHDLAMRNVSEESSDAVLGSALIDMYCKCGLIEEARVVFDKLGDRNIVSWGAMVSGYVEHGLGHAALGLFDDLESEGLSPNRALFLSCTKACANEGDVAKGRHLHSHISLLGLDSDATIGSSVLDMYAKCGSMAEAIRCFEKIGARDAVCWNAMITGCIQHGLHEGAMELFRRMRADKVEPDDVSMLSILQACGQLGALSHGRIVHSMAIESSLASEAMVPALGRSVVDMYARCGSVEDAQKALCALTKQDVVSFSSLIAGYAVSGDCEMIGKCLGMMRERGLEPDRKTFSSLLSACVHAGEIAEGYTYFGAMRSDHGISPGIEHFNSMIGLLAHAGCLEAASEMMGTMPISPDTTGRMSLIAACQNFGSFELGSKCLLHERLHPPSRTP